MVLASMAPMRSGLRFPLIGACLLLMVIFTLWHLETPIPGLGLLEMKNGKSTGTARSDYIYKGPDAEDKVIVIAKTVNETTDWVTEELKDWQQAIYFMDSAEGFLHPPMNKGREAMAYLTFLIDHYHNLPEIMVFLHAHRAGWPRAWHIDEADYDNVKSVQALRLDFVRENGYANLRCIFIPGCPDEIQPFREEADRTAEHAMRVAWPYMFGGTLADVPQVIAQTCCSQFAVTRNQVRKRSHNEYIHYRQWLLQTPEDDATSGRVFEYLWHVIFGKAPVYCPPLEQCWCDQFGRCKE